MATKFSTLHPERGWLRVALPLPVLLYHAHLGWLLGERFLLLTHIGRRSGLPRQTILEVVAHDRASDTYVVVSALGERAQWFPQHSADAGGGHHRRMPPTGGDGGAPAGG